MMLVVIIRAVTKILGITTRYEMMLIMTLILMSAVVMALIMFAAPVLLSV